MEAEDIVITEEDFYDVSRVKDIFLSFGHIGGPLSLRNLFIVFMKNHTNDF